MVQSRCGFGLTDKTLLALRANGLGTEQLDRDVTLEVSGDLFSIEPSLFDAVRVLTVSMCEPKTIAGAFASCPGQRPKMFAAASTRTSSPASFIFPITHSRPA